MKPNQSAVERVIYYSKLLRSIRLTLLELRKTMLLIRELGLTIPSFNDLRDVESELMRRSSEVQQACRLLLEPMFKGIDFGHAKLNHWSLSMDDVKRSWCEMEEILQYNNYDKPHIFGKQYAFLLEEYEDSTLGKFYAGELVPWEVAQHFVDKIPPKKDTLRGLYDAIIESMLFASKYRDHKKMII